MPSTISRTIYSQGSLSVSGVALLAQSVSHNHNKPKENITAFGFKSVQRVASGPETATMEVTFYPTGGEAAVVDLLATDTQAQNPIRTTVRSNVGSIKEALMTSVRGDASVGSVPTVTLSFVGIDDDANVLAAVTPSATAITSIQTTEVVSVNGSGCAQKATFSWDIPVEPINCLGKDIETGAEHFGNPPGSASISVEGTTEPGIVTKVDLGHFAFFVGSGASVSSSSANLAVGQLFGTFNTTTEGIGIEASFSS